MFSDDFIAAASRDGAYIGYACALDFPDGMSRSHTGIGTIQIAGYEYLGVGNLGSVGVVDELGDSQPGRVELELSGIPGSVMSAVLQSKCRGRSGSIFGLVWDENGQLIFAETLLSGTMISYAVRTGSANRVSLTLADKFELYDRALGYRWNDESHQSLESGDRIAQFAAQTADRQVSWGAKKDAQTYKK
ncbi:hypothetical protein [Vibrio sp. H11]|uniref:hypothetical protein n=1 Tax=Vibrio sp. H11 TaxID=2565928 RepID=UPI0010A613D4|nr:hypothetical protein [Vibrio sp. H11]